MSERRRRLGKGEMIKMNVFDSPEPVDAIERVWDIHVVHNKKQPDIEDEKIKPSADPYLRSEFIPIYPKCDECEKIITWEEKKMNHVLCNPEPVYDYNSDGTIRKNGAGRKMVRSYRQPTMCIGCFREMTDQTSSWFDNPPKREVKPLVEIDGSVYRNAKFDEKKRVYYVECQYCQKKFHGNKKDLFATEARKTCKVHELTDGKCLKKRGEKI